MSGDDLGSRCRRSDSSGFDSPADDPKQAPKRTHTGLLRGMRALAQLVQASPVANPLNKSKSKPLRKTPTKDQTPIAKIWGPWKLAVVISGEVGPNTRGLIADSSYQAIIAKTALDLALGAARFGACNYLRSRSSDKSNAYEQRIADTCPTFSLHNFPVYSLSSLHL